MTTNQKYFWGTVGVVILLLVIFRKQIANFINGITSTARAKRCCDVADYTAFANCQENGHANCQGTWLGNCNGAGIGGCKGIQNVGRSQIVNQPIYNVTPIVPNVPNVGNPPPRPILTTG